MAKLTPEQKALNKEATKLRNKAFNQRKGAYRAEIDAAQKAIEGSAVAQAALEADKAVNDALAARDAAVADIEAQLHVLTLKLAETKREYAYIIEPLSAARKAAWDQKMKAQKEAEAAVKAKYPDVADCWSATAWKPYEEFLPLVSAKNVD